MHAGVLMSFLSTLFEFDGAKPELKRPLGEPNPEEYAAGSTFLGIESVCSG